MFYKLEKKSFNFVNFFREVNVSLGQCTGREKNCPNFALNFSQSTYDKYGCVLLRCTRIRTNIVTPIYDIFCKPIADASKTTRSLVPNTKYTHTNSQITTNKAYKIINNQRSNDQKRRSVYRKGYQNPESYSAKIDFMNQTFKNDQNR